MSEPGRIVVTIAEGAATLRLCNAARRNAVSVGMWQEIVAAAAELAARDDVRVVLVRGDGDKAFSAGADISDFDDARGGIGNARGYDDLVDEACRAIEALPQPAVALLHGVCAGGGASLAASCDLRIASTDAFFMVPAARLGLGYDPRQIARLSRVFGFALTRQLLYLGDRLPALRAYALGAVHQAASPGEVERVADDAVRRIAANAPLTLRGVKVALRSLVLQDASLAAEAERLTTVADGSSDYAEGRRAFAEKRTPEFKGR